SMAITLSLSPNLEAKLQDKATKQGKKIDQIATELLTRLLEQEAEDIQAAIIGIQQGLTDFELGDYRDFDNFAEEQCQKYNLSR
ncbi:MAG: hypothetical protein ACK58N_13025, partial [Synechocystis sp.]